MEQKCILEYLSKITSLHPSAPIVKRRCWRGVIKRRDTARQIFILALVSAPYEQA